MKQSIQVGLFLALLVLPVVGRQPMQVDAAAALESALLATDAEQAALRPFIGGYPPRFDASMSPEVATDRLKRLIADLSKLADTSPNNAEIEWRLGDAYRLGHNLDLEGAWQASEAALKRAMAHDPKCFQAYIVLGGLYVDSSPKLAGEAERLFKKAIELAGDRPAPLAYRGLAFAYLMQRDGEKALKAADECVKRFPDLDDMRRLRDHLRKNPRVEIKEAPGP